MTRKTVVCLMGPTASGKTGLAVELVSRGPFEIVSVDSALVYRGMDIGTAKPTADILARAPHRLIDIVEPEATYSAARFRDDARAAIDEIHSAGRIPLLTGGTLLYFRALTEGLTDLPSADAATRERLSSRAEQEGWAALHAELAANDPATAERIHPNDAQRIQRALEIIELTGETPTSLHASRDSPQTEYQFVSLMLEFSDRSLLHQRIADRFEQMMGDGFVDEVARLRERPGLSLDRPSMRAVGYRQIWQHLDGDYDREEAVRRGIAATRQFAKRQMTWLRRTGADLKLSADVPADPDKLLNSLDELLARD